MTLIQDWLNRDEGVKLRPYLDCCGKYWRECVCEKKGKLSIGVGRNLDDCGVSVEEAFFMRDSDISRARKSCIAAFPWYVKLTSDRQDVVACMVFSMGLIRFCDFKQLIFSLEREDYPAARAEMLNSRWASQVGDRAKRLADVMMPP